MLSRADFRSFGKIYEHSFFTKMLKLLLFTRKICIQNVKSLVAAEPRALVGVVGSRLPVRRYGGFRPETRQNSEKRSSASILRAELRGGKDDVFNTEPGVARRRTDGDTLAASGSFAAAPSTSFLSTKGFSDMRLGSPVVAALRSVGIIRVSSIQELALPTILSGRSTLVGAETGSGKTLLYVLPIAQLAFRLSHGAAAQGAAKPAAVGGDSSSAAAQQPGTVALMLLPNQELVLQSAAVLRMVTAGLPCKVVLLSSGIPADLPPPTGPVPGQLTVYAATPAAFVNFADRARRAATAASDAPADAAAAAAAAVVAPPADAAAVVGSAAAEGTSITAAVDDAAAAPEAAPLSKAAMRRARSAAAAAAAATTDAAVPGLSPAAIVALDEADLLASPTHRAAVERALMAVGAAQLLPEEGEGAAGKATAVLLGGKAAGKGSCTDDSAAAAKGRGKSSAATPTTATAEALKDSGPGGRRLVLLPTTQVIATAATLLEPLRASNASLQDGFGAWLHRHMRDAAIIRSPGLHRPTSLVRVRHVYVRDDDIVAGLRLHEDDDSDGDGAGKDSHAGAGKDSHAGAASDGAAARPGPAGSSKADGATADAAGADGDDDAADAAAVDWEEVLAARRAGALLRAVRLTVPERPLLETASGGAGADSATAAARDGAAPASPKRKPQQQAQQKSTSSKAPPPVDPDRGQALVFVNDAVTADEVAGALQALGACCCMPCMRLCRMSADSRLAVRDSPQSFVYCRPRLCFPSLLPLCSARPDGGVAAQERDGDCSRCHRLRLVRRPHRRRGGHRPGGARAGHDARRPRHQLRPARGPCLVPAPHRPHCSCGREGRRCVFSLCRAERECCIVFRRLMLSAMRVTSLANTPSAMCSHQPGAGVAKRVRSISARSGRRWHARFIAATAQRKYEGSSSRLVEEINKARLLAKVLTPSLGTSSF